MEFFLSKGFTEENKYTVVLANPPFKGSIDKSDINDHLTVGMTNTELLFEERMMTLLQIGGKCGVIVPDGVLFGTSNAHKKLRQQGDKTEKVWFYDMEADGYSLDDKRNFIDGKGDIPDIIHNFRKRYEANPVDRKGKCFFVHVEEIKENGYDLSISKDKEIEYEQVAYGKPEIIMENIEGLEDQIKTNISELKGMLKQG
jgi:type I restriction enzyme M protein